jgi:hypothetical protein
MQNLPQNENRNHQGLGTSPKAGSLTFCIDQIENGQAILTSGEAGQINWPTAQLPKGSRVGDQVTLEIPTKKQDGKCCEECNDMEHMRQLLEELVS